MSAHVIIKDGPSPYWWTSSDIWVVPGTDPNGAIGQPVVGQPAYLWAKVSNEGPSISSGVRVDFYWANPAAQISVGVATRIGSAFVDLSAGETADVLCLVPWTPILVNDGHECLIAVAHAPGDINALPDPLPIGFPFNPPAYEQIAQTNLSVLHANKLSATRALMVNATTRIDKYVQVKAEHGGKLSPQMIRRLKLDKLHPAKEDALNVGLTLEPGCGDDVQGKQELQVEVKRGMSLPVYVALDARRLPKGHYQLVHIVERDAEKVLGGITYVVINANEETTS